MLISLTSLLIPNFFLSVRKAWIIKRQPIFACKLTCTKGLELSGQFYLNVRGLQNDAKNILQKMAHPSCFFRILVSGDI